MDKVISRTQYNRKYHKKFYFFHMFHRSKQVYFIAIITILVIALAIYNTITNPEGIQGTLMLWALVSFSIMVTPLLMIQRINGIVKKETEESKASTDTIEVTKVKIQRSNTAAVGKAVVGWQSVEQVCETKDFIYIYTGPSSGLFIVKSDIVEGDVETFRKLAENNMTKNRKGKIKYKKFFKEAK